jgi:hypothetical protein
MKRAIVATTARAVARPAIAVLAAGLLTLAATPPSLATASPILNAQEGEAQPPHCSGCGGITVGGPTASGSGNTVGGSLYDPALPEPAFTGQHVTLSESVFPYADGYTPVAQALVQEDGTFAFTIHPEQETHYVVTWPAGGLASSTVAIEVAAAITTECSVCGLKKHGNGAILQTQNSIRRLLAGDYLHRCASPLSHRSYRLSLSSSQPQSQSQTGKDICASCSRQHDSQDSSPHA